MTSNLSSLLTFSSAGFLRKALSDISRDCADVFNLESRLQFEPIQMAFDWKANDNEKRFDGFLGMGIKRKAHDAATNTKFRNAVDEIQAQYFDDKVTVRPLHWEEFFPTLGLSRAVDARQAPDDTKMLLGSMEHCFAWSDYNLDRMAQHQFTLAICEKLQRDEHIFKHLAGTLQAAKAWVYSKTRSLDSIRTQLVILEGDPVKIQALREELMNDTCKNNVSTGHFYGHLNGQSGSGTEQEKRFKSQVLHHVQVGFNPALGLASTSDFGLS